MTAGRFIKALQRQPVDKTPIWIMRQAGRYLPEYRKVRAEAGSFLKLCKTPELACEVTLQPLRRFDLDAAIIFSDILTIPDAMGLGLTMEEGQGPHFLRPLKTVQDIRSLKIPVPEESLSYVLDAIRLTKPALKVPLIGFSGSPWTLACYMMEGKGSKDFTAVKRLMWHEPQAFKHLLATLTISVSDYLSAQIKAGVDAVMIFDTWGGLLTPADYLSASLEPIRQIVSAIKGKVPVIVFSKGASHSLEAMATIGCDALGIDWTIDLKEARRRVGQQVALQGNLDPAVLHAPDAVIRERAREILGAFQGEPGHVFNLGHGITPDIEPDKVRVLIEAVHVS